MPIIDSSNRIVAIHQWGHNTPSPDRRYEFTDHVLVRVAPQIGAVAANRALQDGGSPVKATVLPEDSPKYVEVDGEPVESELIDLEVNGGIFHAQRSSVAAKRAEDQLTRARELVANVVPQQQGASLNETLITHIKNLGQEVITG